MYSHARFASRDGAPTRMASSMARFARGSAATSASAATRTP